jgi:hypothetical protein
LFYAGVIDVVLYTGVIADTKSSVVLYTGVIDVVL